MAVDSDKIKQAFTEFEKDNFIDAKELLTKEIKNATNSYIEKELDLTKSLSTPVDVKETS
jgi:hypothetical protein